MEKINGEDAGNVEGVVKRMLGMLRSMMGLRVTW